MILVITFIVFIVLMLLFLHYHPFFDITYDNDVNTSPLNNKCECIDKRECGNTNLYGQRLNVPQPTLIS